MNHFIADLHCDLLWYLETDLQRTAYDEVARCSIPQLREGNVKLQTLAVFAKTGPQSVEHGMAQVEIYKNLPETSFQDFVHFTGNVQDILPHQIATVFAFEGASTFCSEEEPIDQGINRLQWVIENVANPLYISMTWNMENRFGGGASTQIGLKEDGKRLLQFMYGKKIAIDLSHASDALAYDIFTYIDQNSLEIPVIASHSNSRLVTDVARNLPDELAIEILRRGGVIGMNFYRKFVGKHADESFVKHLAHWIDLGGAKQVCFGADFFYTNDETLGVVDQKDQHDPMFFLQYQDASCYHILLNVFKRELNVKAEMIADLAHNNFINFLNRSQIFY